MNSFKQRDPFRMNLIIIHVSESFLSLFSIACSGKLGLLDGLKLDEVNNSVQYHLSSHGSISIESITA